MPSQLPASFASAAATNGSNEGNSNVRNTLRGEGSGEWSRARTNGVTQTFRRPSLATSASHQRDSSQSNTASANTGVYVPPHLNSNYQPNFSRNTSMLDSRYSKEQLLTLFRTQGESGALYKNTSEYLVEGWSPAISSTNNNSTWNRRDEFKDGNHGPEICWDNDGAIQPLGLTELSEEEKELFTSSVNSPLKPPPQSSNEKGTPTSGINGRKSSISLMQPGGPTPSTGRPGPRRRETSDSLPSANPLASPTVKTWISRDEQQMSTPSPSIVRRRTDFKDSNFGIGSGDKSRVSDRPETTLDTSSPFSSFKRTATGPVSAGNNGPSSPWSGAPQSAGFPSMGAFGSFSLGTGASGQPPTPGEKKLGFGSSRGESRFKGLMSQDSSEDMLGRNKDKTSISNLEKLTEMDTEPRFGRWTSNRPDHQSKESNPFDEPDQHVGSAALGGDVPSPPAHLPSMPNQTDHQRTHDDIGFSTFGTSSDMPSFRDMMQRRDYSQQQTPQSTQYTSTQHHEPMSPTNTNPYQSPEGDKTLNDDLEIDGSDALNMHHSAFNLGGHSGRLYNSTYEAAASDRSQTSSTGPSRGFPNLNGLGGLGGIGTSGGWSAAPGVVGTPIRANPGFASGFGDSIFSSFADIQSLNHSGSGALGSTSSAQHGNVGTIGRGSKMGSLFPLAMQDQMRGNEPSRSDQTFADARDSQNSGRAAVGTNAPGFANIPRDSDSPSRQNRGMLDDFFGGLDGRGRGLQGLNSPFQLGDGMNAFSQGPSFNPIQTPTSGSSTILGLPSVLTPSASSAIGRSPDPDSSSNISSQMPATQQRQMVMPDRMRWIYRDPQGNTQGPWSGLEMHDWYKAGFFSPELQVKKLEDADYEPLAQLIRRIGNSREPFLVPQIGIPHGSAGELPRSNTSVLGAIPATSPSAQPGSAHPPFASSFPSFGTTLTAEQQNALERRKQEEQYLMARQKEHLAQQQVMIKQMQHMQSGPHSMHSQQLHHHSSAHSLQSQPSYGSITSPTGYQPSPAQGPIQQHGAVPGFFDSLPRPSALGMATIGIPPDSIQGAREGEAAVSLDRLNLGRGAQVPFGSSSQNAGPQEGLGHHQQVTAMLQDRARLQREQDQYELLHRNSMGDGQEAMTRLDQYKQLRAYEEIEAQKSQGPTGGRPPTHQNVDFQDHQVGLDHSNLPEYHRTMEDYNVGKQDDRSSIGEQLPTTFPSIIEAATVQTQSPWPTVEPGLPMPFPPPQSASPLPAPAAQRNRQNVADTLAAESRSRSQTPSVETPSAVLAPWAKENIEGAKGPSLKEIQEAEARQAAQQEAIAAATRRAQVEQERSIEMQSAPPAPGLPSTANWARSGSPATPTSGAPSAWAKPLAGKPATVASTSGAKKTLAQIQKEEEARKNRVAAATAANAVNSLAGIPTLPGGKRYADLAGKVASPISTGVGGAWTTVGAGGKLKTPVGPPSATSPVSRALSGGSIMNVTTNSRPKPAIVPVRSNTAGGSAGGQSANDELYKWAKSALGKGLNTSINVDDFVRNLLQLPSEPEILSEAVYANSPTLDGRRFAEEFIRRRKLADKGIIPETSASTGFSPANGGENKSGGGWSEVAKKGPINGAKEEPNSAFKVVATKKKGKR